MKFRDLFTYQADVSGKRKMRTYVKAAIIIIAALIVLWVVAYYQQSQQIRAIQETKPVVLPSPTPTIPQPPTFTPEPTAVTESCPTDPADWNLVEITPDDPLLRIEPACVYEGLERTVAFSLGIREGYSRQEVADALGFESLPMVRLAQVTVASPSGPLPMNVGFAVDIPPFTEWIFQENGAPAEVMTLQGCFRTYTIVGNEKQNWDENDYPVACRVTYDNVSSGGVYCMGDACYSITNNPASNRSFLLFGYAGDGRWIWLGTEMDTVVQLDSQTMSEDRAFSATLQGVGPWDRDWLEQVFGLTVQPLPENWQYFSSEADEQKLRDALKVYSSGGTSP